MSIAPLAVLGVAKTAFNIIGALAGAAKNPEAARASAQAPVPAAQESIWHQLGRDVDVRALTREDLARVSQLLYGNGAIGLQEHAVMSFDPSFAGSTGLLTSPDSAGRVDWVAEFSVRLERHLAAGDTQAAAGDRRVLDILARLRTGSRGVTSLRV